MQWLTETELGKAVFTALVSMLPVVELRGGIPFGVGTLGLGPWTAFFSSVAGNMLPIPFIVVYIRRIFKWLRGRHAKLDRLVSRLEGRAHLKGRLVTRYRLLGLCVLVAIPLPGTGAWTGALVAAFLDLRLRDAFLSIFFGVILAGFAVMGITYGFAFFF
ncbi:MAG: small multi-drug export protein [Clostridiales bacterium]|nr:small multi-drug export protein [Clostridiales bacterium]